MNSKYQLPKDGGVHLPVAITWVHTHTIEATNVLKFSAIDGPYSWDYCRELLLILGHILRVVERE